MEEKQCTTFGEFILAGGPMYGEKTATITSQVKKMQLANTYGQNINCALFKPAADTRDGPYIVSRVDGEKFPATLVKNSREILSVLEQKVQVVGIDEIELFTPIIVPVIKTLMKNGVDVYAAGLDLDFKGEPFGSMPELIALSTQYIKTTAICSTCGDEARFTQRLYSDGTPVPYDSPTVLIQERKADGTLPKKPSYIYEPRCFLHHEVPGKPGGSLR